MIKLHTKHGVITLELDAAKAPDTVANFLQYVNDGHYNNTIFHRVIDGFMIQGGGFEPGMKQKPTRERRCKNEADNGLKNDSVHDRHGAHLDPHSASAQFFINVGDNDFLEPHRADRAGLGLLRVRQGGRWHGRRRPHQGENRQPRHAPGRAGRRRSHHRARRGLLNTIFCPCLNIP